MNLWFLWFSCEGQLSFFWLTFFFSQKKVKWTGREVHDNDILVGRFEPEASPLQRARYTRFNYRPGWPHEYDVNCWKWGRVQPSCEEGWSRNDQLTWFHHILPSEVQDKHWHWDRQPHINKSQIPYLEWEREMDERKLKPSRIVKQEIPEMIEDDPLSVMKETLPWSRWTVIQDITAKRAIPHVEKWSKVMKKWEIRWHFI